MVSRIFGCVAVAASALGGSVRECARQTVAKLRPIAGPVLSLGAVFGFSRVASATDPLLPDTGVDLEALILEGITAMGAVVTVIVGSYFGFLLIKKGMTWARRAF